MGGTARSWRLDVFGWLGAALILACGAGAVPAYAVDELPTRVGRVSDFGGELYLAPQDRATEWATVGVNYPVTSGDNLWVAPRGRAEIDFGAGQLRLAGDTNLQVGMLDEHQFALYVASGRVILRMRTLEPGDSALVDTPHGQIQIDRPGLYRVDVAPERQQTLLLVREGEARVRFTGGTRQVLPGQMATIDAADPADIALQTGFGSDGFDAWSAVRDRRYDSSTSERYVSSEMVGATDLNDYGAWESYAAYGNVWFPTTVAVGWAPYRFGRWTWVGAWGWSWVDDAPWGYAPFHYGRWIWLSGRWGWCPGAFVRRPVWAPALVGWLGGPGWAFSTSLGSSVYGWVPLGWGDPFWPHWRCSASCRRALNHPFAADVAERAGAATRFANSEVPAAVTWVPGHVLTDGRPVAVNLVRPPPSALASVPVLATATIARGNPPSMTHRPVGAPPSAGLFRRGPPASVPSAVADPRPTDAPSEGLPRAHSPPVPTPNDGGRTVGAAPREIAPAPRSLRGAASAPATRVYGGVTDGRGAYTGVVPTPGPKLPASADRGISVSPTTIYPVVPAAPPALAPATPSGVAPEVRHIISREAAARNAPVPSANPGVAPASPGLGAK